MSMLEVALAAAGQAWRVFPLAPGHKTPRRQLTTWEAKATCDPARIERWWTTHQRDNVGIACGPSGLVVVDLDPAKTGETPPERWAGATGGAQVLEWLGHDRGETLGPTWTVDTPSGGRHLYYQAPAGRELRNTAGRIGWRIDTRAAGGFVVAAGSIVDGRRYQLVDDTSPAELPGWLLAVAEPPAPPAPRLSRPASRARGYVETSLANEVRRVLAAGDGTRNDTLNTAAWALGRLVAQGVVPRHVVESALQGAGEATGLAATEVTATVRSALDARLRRGPRP
jgi:hypothetical protein